MERYYLVLNTLTATARHSNPGEVHMHIYGKRQKHLYAAGDVYYDFDMLTPHHVREYGYTRKQDAARNWVYTHPDSDAPQWKGEVRIVQAWVRHNGTVDIIT